MSTPTVRPGESFDYYAGDIFFNNFECFLERECRLISGNATTGWQRYLFETYGKLGSAFVFGFGNGWVERGLFQTGVIDRVVGFDIMPKYVEQATAEAARIGMPAHYSVADSSTFVPNGLRAQLAVNNGAMHHVAYINRLTALLAEICADGLYVGHDYTGAHRNQYSWEVWSRTLELSLRLPDKYRVPLRYPHLRTMLATDPSEAVHAELQMEVLLRHFDIVKHVRLGGGLCHQLLMNNHRLHRERHTEEGRAALELIMQEEEAALAANPDFNLFTFFIAKPKPTPASAVQRLHWQAEEDEREAKAARHGGRYGAPSALETIYDELANAEYKLSQLAPPAGG